MDWWNDSILYLKTITGLKSNSNNNIDDSIFKPFVNQTLSNKFQALLYPMPIERYQTTTLTVQMLLNCIYKMLIVNIIDFTMNSGYHLDIALISPFRKEKNKLIIPDTLWIKDFDTD